MRMLILFPAIIAAAPALSADAEPARQYEELLAAVAEKRDVKAFAPRFLEFAEKHPKTPEAVEALVWLMRNAAHLPEADQAARLVLETHADNRKILMLCEFNLTHSPFPSAEWLLRGMLDKAKDNEGKAQAQLNLANHLVNKAEMLKQLKSFDAKRLATIEERYGKELIRKLREENTETLLKEAEKRLDDLVAAYPDAKKQVDSAKSELFSLRHLQVGKPAPDIEGEDLEGKKFKLSDYRGKVVLLDFWGHWCPHCIAMVPHEIELVKKMENRPFALIGVNSGDSDRDEVVKENARLKITWRNFFDGDDQKIAHKWKITGFPTLFLIDHQGVIREKFIGRPDEKALDEAVEKLVAEAEKARPK